MEPLDIRNEEKFRKIREILGGERKRDQGSRDSLPLLKKKMILALLFLKKKPTELRGRMLLSQRTVYYNLKGSEKI
jgi:hypothetical protein